LRRGQREKWGANGLAPLSQIAQRGSVNTQKNFLPLFRPRHQRKRLAPCPMRVLMSILEQARRCRWIFGPLRVPLAACPPIAGRAAPPDVFSHQPSSPVFAHIFPFGGGPLAKRAVPTTAAGLGSPVSSVRRRIAVSGSCVLDCPESGRGSFSACFYCCCRGWAFSSKPSPFPAAAACCYYVRSGGFPTIFCHQSLIAACYFLRLSCDAGPPMPKPLPWAAAMARHGALRGLRALSQCLRPAQKQQHAAVTRQSNVWYPLPWSIRHVGKPANCRSGCMHGGERLFDVVAG
ncbi:hypothetical protein DL89DRAFT_316301, partial [Linderina pennispora]